MNYFVVEIVKYMDGTKNSSSVYSYETLNEAKATFHTKVGGGMKNANYKEHLVKVIDMDGTSYENSRFVREVEENGL